MTKYTVDQIADAAEGACFYVAPTLGCVLRIQYCEMDEGYLMGLDENSGEEYKFTFEEIAEQEDPHFEHLARTKIGE